MRLIIFSILGLWLARPVSSQQYVAAEISPQPVLVVSGASAAVTVRLSIAQGWHLPAHGAGKENAQPLTVVAVSPRGLSVSAVSYPDGVRKKFQFASDPLEIYEHDCVIRLTLAAAARLKPGAYKVPVVIRYQACNQIACVLPDSLSVEIPVVIPSPKSPGNRFHRGRRGSNLNTAGVEDSLNIR